ncbi:P-loop containing nucleoside triphosphate hydrolase protein [Aspergillus undulatus]|uniref:P-loop containing nucleoside triphosphate hydrolase protein n=1 Tax=Aspergillus undulatus TaxID=1810928 RepID=UPI003CCCAE16
MDVLNSTAQRFTDQVRRLSAVTGLTQPDAADRFFLVMGKTGSGKSTFVARCTGQDVTVGHGLFSCTSSIDTYSYTLPYTSRRIHLIDSPGFNDTNRSDIETLEILASYLGASYANGVRIHGIIMLHPITDNRMGGSSMRNIEMMKKMCGFSSYKNLVVAITMWPSSNAHDLAALEDREVELFTDQRFLGELVSKGAAVYRHNERGTRNVDEERRSARQIVSHLVAQSDAVSAPQILRLQREIIDEDKTLGETAAGMAVAGDLYKARKEHERQLRDLERELKGRLAQVNASHAADLQQLRADINSKVAKAEKEKQKLRKSMQEMHEEEERAWEEKFQALDDQFREQIAKKEEELEELEESIEEIRKQARLSRWSSQDEQECREHEEIVQKAKEDVVEARTSRDRFKGQASNIANGLASGFASGAATTVVTAALAGTLLCNVM